MAWKTATWGILADIIGRKPSFNITLFLAGVFGIAAGGANDFTTLGALIACLGFGVGGKYVALASPCYFGMLSCGCMVSAILLSRFSSAPFYLGQRYEGLFG